LPVLDHARTKRPPNYSSDNHRKWEFNNRFYQKHLEAYLDRMYKYLTFAGARRVLDAGCGEGIVYRAMRERGYDGDWTGFDNSAPAIEFAREASPEAEWHVASAYELPFGDRSHELVFSSQVLEHLEKPLTPLREYARVADHWLLLSVPLEPYFRTLTWLSTKLGLGGDPGHVNHWNPEAFRSFCRRVGRLHTWDRTTIYQISLVDVRGLEDTEPVQSAL